MSNQQPSLREVEDGLGRVNLEGPPGGDRGAKQQETLDGGRVSNNNDQGGHVPATTAADDDPAIISPELIVKHPLQSSWTLWFYKPDKNKDVWEDSQKRIITFDTVEDFWALYNHIESASKITNGCDYSLFKEGIKPMWEDKMNCKGGKWNIDLEKKQRAMYLDRFWLEVMLCLIGESFEDHSSFVNGAVVALRGKGDRIGLWLSDYKAADAVKSVGRKLKDHLCIDQSISLQFFTHEVSRARTGSSSKSSYIV